MISITRRALGVLVIKPAKGGAQLTVNASGNPAQIKVRLDIARQGPPGRAGGGAGGAYNHTQSIAGAVWTVPHNLNRRPNVTTTDNLDRVIVGDVAYIDSNIVQITHGSALTGYAYCS